MKKNMAFQATSFDTRCKTHHVTGILSLKSLPKGPSIIQLNGVGTTFSSHNNILQTFSGIWGPMTVDIKGNGCFFSHPPFVQHLVGLGGCMTQDLNLNSIEFISGYWVVNQGLNILVGQSIKKSYFDGQALEATLSNGGWINPVLVYEDIVCIADFAYENKHRHPILMGLGTITKKGKPPIQGIWDLSPQNVLKAQMHRDLGADISWSGIVMWNKKGGVSLGEGKLSLQTGQAIDVKPENDGFISLAPVTLGMPPATGIAQFNKKGQFISFV